MADMFNSFWKLTRERREELLWRPLAEALGTEHYDIYDNGTRADIYPSLARYSYEVVTRSEVYINKFFQKGYLNQRTLCGNYTVVNLTITPPQFEEGERIYIPEPPTVVLTYPTCTSISTISRGYTILEVKDACLIPFKLERILTMS